MEQVKTIRSSEVDRAFSVHLSRLQTKYPDITNFLSEKAVDYLRQEGVVIERITEQGLFGYIMESSHPWDNPNARHLVFYPGESDYALMAIDPALANPENPRHQTFKVVTQTMMIGLASLYIQKHAHKDCVIVMKSTGTLPETPHVHLLIFNNESKDSQSPKKDSKRR